MQNPPQQLQWPVSQMSAYNVGGHYIPVFVGCKFWSQEGSNLKTTTVQSLLIPTFLMAAFSVNLTCLGSNSRERTLSNLLQFQVPVSKEPNSFTEKIKAPLQL